MQYNSYFNGWCLVCSIYLATIHFLIDLIVFLRRCVYHGVLPEEEAKKLFKKVLARKKKGGSTAAAASPVRKKKKHRAKVVSDAADPDMQAGGPERIGSTVL